MEAIVFDDEAEQTAAFGAAEAEDAHCGIAQAHEGGEVPGVVGEEKVGMGRWRGGKSAALKVEIGTRDVAANAWKETQIAR